MMKSQNGREDGTFDRRVAHAILAAFVFALWLPLIAAVVTPDLRASQLDNRVLAPWPEVVGSAEGLSNLPSAFDRYYDDHLGFRSELIRAHAWVSIRLLGVSPNETLLVGRDGWLYLDHEVAIAQARGVFRLDPSRLEAWAGVLEGRRSWLAERGVGYLVVFVPNKHSIYPEFLPASIEPAGVDDSVARLVEQLRERTRVQILDLTPLMENAKQRNRVYHLTDTHWNGVGAYLAYKAILAEIGPILGPDASLRPASINVRRYEAPGIGLAELVGLSDVIREEMIDAALVAPRAKVEREFRGQVAARTVSQLPFAYGVADPTLPSAVVFRDSFGNALIPYLSENFRRVLYVWDRDVVPRFVEAEAPDIVIQVIAARLIDRAPRSIDEVAR